MAVGDYRCPKGHDVKIGDAACIVNSVTLEGSDFRVSYDVVCPVHGDHLSMGSNAISRSKENLYEVGKPMPKN